MEDNLYEPPKSDVTRAEKPGSPIKAIILGSLVEIGGTLAVGIVIGILYAMILGSQGVTGEEMLKRIEQIDPWSGIGVVSLFMGLLVSMLAGNVCARIANTTSYRPVYMLAGISFALSWFFGYGAYDLTELTILGSLSVGAVLLGAWMHNRKIALD